MSERRRIVPKLGLETGSPVSCFSNIRPVSRMPHDSYFDEPDSVQKHFARNNMKLRLPNLRGPDHDMSKYESARHRR